MPGTATESHPYLPSYISAFGDRYQIELANSYLLFSIMEPPDSEDKLLDDDQDDDVLPEKNANLIMGVSTWTGASANNADGGRQTVAVSYPSAVSNDSICQNHTFIVISSRSLNGVLPLSIEVTGYECEQ
jgi:hypothetical protein